MNKKVGIIIGVVVILLLLGGGGYMMMGKKASPVTPAGEGNQEVQTLKPEDIGLKVAMTVPNKKVKVIVGNVSDIKSLEYEVTYDADVPAAEKLEGGEDRVSRGFSDQAEIKSGQSSYESKEFDLGSCSKNVCRYDTGITEIKVLMKVTKRDGSLYQVEDSLQLSKS
jgi:hypothetical protein